MNRLEQSREYLRQYLRLVQNVQNYPWFVLKEHHDRARFSLFDLGGMASDWRTDQPYTTYYHTQRQGRTP